MAACEVFCYGELGIDNIIHVPHLPSPEVAAFPIAESYHVGGVAANTAIWLAHWEVPVRLAGNAIGLDTYGYQLYGWFSQHPALDTQFITRDADTVTPFSRVMVTPDGERSFLLFWYPKAPKPPLKPEMLGGARFVALDLYGGDERLAAARVTREEGAQTVVGDVVWPDHAALPMTDIATNSAAFVRQTFPGVDVRRHARELQAVSRGIIATTDGPRPVHVLDRDGVAFSIQPPPVRPVDATGAGDAFRAGLIYGLLQEWTLAESARWATAAGALAVQQEGAATQPAAAAQVAEAAATLEVRPAT